MRKRPVTEDDTIYAGRELVRERFSYGARRALQFYRGTFWYFSEGRYQEIWEDEVRAIVWKYLEQKVPPEIEGQHFQPKQYLVGNVLESLKALCLVRNVVELPAWIENAPSFASTVPTSEVLSVKNGILHLSTQTLYPHTPALFCTVASSAIFDPSAPPPHRWLRFLDELFSTDVDARESLQEWIGYNLLPDIAQQKLFLIVGPKRSGKGTIARVMAALVGEGGIGSMTLAALSERFGLHQLVGKQCCIIPDARFGNRSDATMVVERLLSISGGDRVPVDRKFLPVWTGQLATRFTIMTNEIPHLTDASGALTDRFIVVQLRRSFLDREDIKLSDKLLAELPGILNWAIAGYLRLRDRGRFLQPLSGRETIEVMSAMTSPIKAFVEEKCKIGPSLVVAKDELFSAWKTECEKNNVTPGTRELFGRDLRAAFPEIGESRPSVGHRRVRMYKGIALGSSAVAPHTEKIVQLRAGEEKS